jgi:serine/threonine protein kinase
MPVMPGETVGPYCIIEQLGQGGVATVYKAYHAALDRDVAIKVLHPAFKNDPQFFARFQREARIVAKLEHSHIVPVYDFNEHEGEPYLVMRYVQGGTLKYHLKNTPMDPAEVLRLMRPICSALTYAHKQGVLHRDIKPSNIMLAKDGSVFLTDFGLARMTEIGESTLSKDMMVGTPQYISPEQAQGLKDLDDRTDIYSLGVILFEMLTGSVPYSSDTPFAIIHDHIYKPLPLPHTIYSDIDPKAEKVILRALAKDPNDRFATVQDFLTALEGALLPQITQGPPSTEAINEKRRSKRWYIVGAAVLMVLFLCTCLVFLSAVNENRQQEQKSTATAQGAAPETPAGLPFEEPDSLQVQGDKLAEQGDLEGALEKYIAAVEADPQDIMAYYRVANTLVEFDRSSEAGEFLWASIENNPGQIEPWLILGYFQMRDARLPEARRTFENIITQRPDNALAYAGLSRVHTLAGDLEAAEASLVMAKELNPESPEVQLAEAHLLWAKGERATAIRLLRQVAQNPALSLPLRDELRRLSETTNGSLP